MEIPAIKKNIFIMITKNLFYRSIIPLIYVSVAALVAVSCLAGTKSSNEKSVTLDTQASKRPIISDKIRNTLKNSGYTIQPPENIKKPEVVDNIPRIKSLFGNNDDIFFSYGTLTRFLIFKGRNRIGARLYCFQFKNRKEALTWFRVLDNSKSQGTRRLVVFRKPKKLSGLAGDRVFLLEGYFIDSFETLYFIIKQMDNLEYILGPNETKKLKISTDEIHKQTTGQFPPKDKNLLFAGLGMSKR
jgi:hypothetical protein